MGNDAYAQALGRTVEARTIRTISTPDGVPLTVQIADLGSRFGAAVFDFFIVGVVSDLILLLFALLNASLGQRWGLFWYFRFEPDDLLLVTGALIGFVVRLIYFPLFEYVWRGQSPGKRALGLRVIDRSGGPLTIEQILARNLVREIEFWLPLTLILTPVAVGNSLGTNVWGSIFLVSLSAVPLTNKERMRGGDMLGGTWVIAEPKPVLLPELSRSTGTFSKAQLQLYGVSELEVLANVLRETGPTAIELRRVVEAKIRSRLLQVGQIPEPQDGRFLESFYSALRDHLEKQKMTTGYAPADKKMARHRRPGSGPPGFPR